MKSQHDQARPSPDACPSCGTEMQSRQGALTHSVNGEVVSVPRLRYARCPACEEVVLDLQAARHLRREALRTYRSRYGLLTGREIRDLRERLGLTQASLAALLRLGANTISRWEADRNVQSASMDVLLRLIRDVPGALDYLRDRAA